MKLAMALNYSGDFHADVTRVQELEKAGLDVVWVAEAYSYDAISQVGYLAARTERLEIGTGIVNVYSRTPALMAMTAAGCDFVSNGRFVLGLGASGPQVVEGFHGVPYDKPMTRIKEYIDICRMTWRREPVVYDGEAVQVPLPAGKGTGLGKPLKLVNHPVRPRIPLVLAALGPKNVALAAELFDGWEPLFYLPEGADRAFGAALSEGNALRDPARAPLEIYADTTVEITDDPDRETAALQKVRAHLALYIGGMGAKGKNFYNDVAVRYGFEAAATKVQDLFLSGKKAEAAAALPEELVRGVSLIGDESRIKDRLRAMAETGVTTINATPLSPAYDDRLATIRKLRELAG